MVANLHRNGVDQRTATELNRFYNGPGAAIISTVSECVISWSICVPGFRKYTIYGGTRRRESSTAMSLKERAWKAEWIRATIASCWDSSRFFLDGKK